MKSASTITLIAALVCVISCSKSTDNSVPDEITEGSAWNGSELLSMVVKLKAGMTRKAASDILGEEIYITDQGNDCVQVAFVKEHDSFIGRHWVSGGPHSFTGITVSFIDDRLVYVSINPGYVDQDRYDAYYDAYPVDHESSDPRGQNWWDHFHYTSGFRRNQGESGRREVFTPAPHTTGHTGP